MFSTQGCYMTIHITPERSCSYVSFESNVPVSSYDEVIARVLQAFRPAKFVLTVFATPVRVAYLLWIEKQPKYIAFWGSKVTETVYNKELRKPPILHRYEHVVTSSFSNSY